MAIIQTQRLYLREATTADAPFIYELLNSPKWLQFIGDRGIKNMADATAYIENSLIKSYREHGFGLYVMVVKETGMPIGICGLINRPTLPDIDIGFALLPDYEGLGYGFEAAKATLEYAKNQLGLTTILGITLPENTASSKLLEKIGLKLQKRGKIEGDEEELLIYST